MGLPPGWLVSLQTGHERSRDAGAGSARADGTEDVGGRVGVAQVGADDHHDVAAPCMPAATAASVASHTMSSVVDHRWPRTAVTPHVSDRARTVRSKGLTATTGTVGRKRATAQAVSPDGVQHTMAAAPARCWRPRRAPSLVASVILAVVGSGTERRSRPSLTPHCG